MEADKDAIVTEPVEDSRPAVIELVWRERLPLGMNLLLNDDSGQLKVVDFPRGSQARAVCEKRGLSADAFEGASIVTVNGTRYEHDAEEELFEALKDPARPKSVGFVLAESEEAERMRKFLEEAEDTKQDPVDDIEPRSFALQHALFNEPGELGIQFGNSPDGTSLVVMGFLSDDSGIVLAAERCSNIHVGDVLTHINDNVVLSIDGASRHSKAIDLLQTACNARPLKLSFCEPYLHEVCIQKDGNRSVNSARSGGPDELLLEQLTTNSGKRRICICGFDATSGAVESAGILLGDHLVFANGEPVGVGCRWMSSPRIPSLAETLSILQSPENYPIALTFARPKQTAAPRSPRWGDDGASVFHDSEADTICVTAECFDQLGITLDESSSGGSGSIVVGSFLSVPGPFQRSLPATAKHPQYQLALESIDKRVLPSYATPQLVKNALNRSWKTERPTQLLLCDDTMKEWLNNEINLKEGKD